MKKLVLIFLLIAVGLCACANEEPKPGEAAPKAEQSAPPKVQPAVNEPQITVNIEAVTEKYCTLVIETDYAEGEITCGQDFYIKKNGEKLVPVVPEEQITWDMIAYLIKPGEPCRIEQNWEYIYGALPDGEYEMVKQIYIKLPNGERIVKEVSAEFGFATVYD